MKMLKFTMMVPKFYYDGDRIYYENLKIYYEAVKLGGFFPWPTKEFA